VSGLTVTDLPLAGLKCVARTIHGDARGFLTRLFCADTLAGAGFTPPVAQINHTFTAARGTVRGMHFQYPPHAEIKLVSCIRGEIWDVAVDLRQGSPTFLHWHAERLSAANGRALLIPAGCAHGFQTLTDDCELIYAHSHAYVPMAEGGLRPDDPGLAITWPLPVAGLSPRDRSHPLLSVGFPGIVLPPPEETAASR
jgi:dTDP-4-dehydrorhamnose 3,5-epimerase